MYLWLRSDCYISYLAIYQVIFSTVFPLLKSHLGVNSPQDWTSCVCHCGDRGSDTPANPAKDTTWKWFPEDQELDAPHGLPTEGQPEATVTLWTIQQTSRPGPGTSGPKTALCGLMGGGGGNYVWGGNFFFFDRIGTITTISSRQLGWRQREKKNTALSGLFGWVRDYFDDDP